MNFESVGFNVQPSSKSTLSELYRKRKQPALMAAKTKMSPTRLNHAVVQPQPRPPRIDAQWYSPPAVGNADAICAIVAATARENRHSGGQDADDRQRNGKVRKPAHPPQQLLRIAEPMQRPHIVSNHILPRLLMH